MRLLILCEYPTLNGGERSMLATLDGVRRADYEVCIAAPAVGPLAETLRERGVPAISFESRSSADLQLPLDDRRRQLAEILRAQRPDLLHANSLATGRLSGPVAADLGIPSVSHLRDIVSLSRQAITDLNRHVRLLAVSEATRTFHLAQGLSVEKTHVLYNGVDTERFRPAPPGGWLHEELGLPRDVPLLGTIGQISLRKGHDVAAAALAKLQADVAFAWLVIGERFSAKDESRQFEEQLRRAADGPLAGRLFFLGTRNDIERILPELTLLVHPARQEPLGRVLLEAAACGCAVVATEVGGTPEIFPSAIEAARLVPPDDPRALADAIRELLLDPARRDTLGRNARRKMEEVFSIERATAGLLAHYRAVLENGENTKATAQFR